MIYPAARAAAEEHTLFYPDHVEYLFAHRLTAVIVDKTEPVAVIRRREIVPDREGYLVFVEPSYDVGEPVFPPLDGTRADRAELSAGEHG